MQRLEMLLRGQLVVTDASGRVDHQDEVAPTSTELAWIADGWQPSLAYFLQSEVVDSRRGGDVDATERRTEPEPDAISTRAPEEPPVTQDSGTVAGLLVRRRSVRQFNDANRLNKTALQRVTIQQMSMMQARLGKGLSGLCFRLLNYRVYDCDPGLYNIGTDGSFAKVRFGDFREQMVDIMCGMEAARTADATIVISFDAAARQAAFPYERALRELYIDAGRIAQWWIIAMEREGLGSLITPATNDMALSKLLNLPRGEFPLYTVTFGPKQPRRARVE